jgi:hypothetical protein
VHAGLKKPSSFVWTDSSAFLNAMCLLKYELNFERHFSYFNPDYPTYGLTVTGLARYCTSILYEAIQGGIKVAEDNG